MLIYRNIFGAHPEKKQLDAFSTINTDSCLGNAHLPQLKTPAAP